MPHVPHVPRRGVPGVDGRSLRWQSHNAERRAQVLAAAVELVEEQAPGAEIHVQQIAERAGLARTVVYRLFNNRADLQRAVQLRVVDEIRAVLESNFALSGSTEEIIASIVGSYVDWVAEHPQLHDMAERELGDGEPGEIERAIDALTGELSELLQAGAVLLGNDLDEKLRAVLDLLVVGLIGQVRGAVNQWVRRPERTPSARTLTALLSRWIWYQIDGQARELGVVVDPARPLSESVASAPGRPRPARPASGR